MITLQLQSESDVAEGLIVLRMRAKEKISQLFEISVDVVSDNAGVVLVDLIGVEATVVILNDGVELRRISAMISAVEERFEPEGQKVSGRLFLSPRAHRLTFVRMQDISLDMSVIDIVKHKLKLVDLDDDATRRLSLLSPYPARDFVVQWEETDLAYLGRLTEHVGVSFFFEQTEDGDRMVFVDHNGGFPAVPNRPVAHLSRRSDDLGVKEISVSRTCIPHACVVMDYNYRTPNMELTSTAQIEDGYAGGVIEYGGHFKTAEEGDALARIRVEEFQSSGETFQGTSDLCELTAGHHFQLEGHSRLEGSDLLLVEVQHEASSGGYDGAAGHYKNSFTAFAMSRSTYRPPRVTPRPRIHGLLTGLIEPRDDSTVERHARIDEHGRYVVKFLYDMTRVGERKASHAVRKAEPTVGPDYGMHFPLRPGVEVVMAFVNGDPDRPIIVGGLHNAVVPAHVRATNAQINAIKTASGIKMHFKDD